MYISWFINTFQLFAQPVLSWIFSTLKSSTRHVHTSLNLEKRGRGRERGLHTSIFKNKFNYLKHRLSCCLLKILTQCSISPWKVLFRSFVFSAPTDYIAWTNIPNLRLVVKSTTFKDIFKKKEVNTQKKKEIKYQMQKDRRLTICFLYFLLAPDFFFSRMT